MNEELHKRAQRLLNQSAVEGLRPADENWLRQHLAECGECARDAAGLREAMHALRSVAVLVPRDLAARTQMRVRLRAQESAAGGYGSFWLWTVTAASWLLGVFSAPLVWRVISWAGGNFGVPKLALEVGFVLWWTVPALIAVGAVLYHRAGSARTKGI